MKDLLSETGNSPTPYDDSFKTLIHATPRLVIPLINELFGTHYSREETIVPLADELFLFTGTEKRVKKITDSNLDIHEEKYHIECQSTPDGTMIVRMFQYDVNIAIQNASFQKWVLNVDFPNSAVIFLRCEKNMPDKMKISIHTPGDSVTYNVEVLKIRDYSIEELFEKELYILLPFYAFNLEKSFKEINADAEKVRRLRQRYDEIVVQLEELILQNRLEEQEAVTVVDMMKNVLNYLTRNHSEIKKEVAVMGGHVLKTTWDYAIEEGAFAHACKMLGKGKLTIEEVTEEFGKTEEEILHKMEELKLPLPTLV